MPPLQRHMPTASVSLSRTDEWIQMNEYNKELNVSIWPPNSPGSIPTEHLQFVPEQVWSTKAPPSSPQDPKDPLPSSQARHHRTPTAIHSSVHVSKGCELSVLAAAHGTLGTYFLMLCRIGVKVWAMCCKGRPVSSLSALQSYFQHKEEKGKTEEKCELCKKVCKVQSKQKANKSLNTKEAAQSVFL